MANFWGMFVEVTVFIIKTAIVLFSASGFVGILLCRMVIGGILYDYSNEEKISKKQEKFFSILRDIILIFCGLLWLTVMVSLLNSGDFKEALPWVFWGISPYIFSTVFLIFGKLHEQKLELERELRWYKQEKKRLNEVIERWRNECSCLREENTKMKKELAELSKKNENVEAEQAVIESEKNEETVYPEELG